MLLLLPLILSSVVVVVVAVVNLMIIRWVLCLPLHLALLLSPPPSPSPLFTAAAASISLSVKKPVRTDAKLLAICRKSGKSVLLLRAIVVIGERESKVFFVILSSPLSSGFKMSGCHPITLSFYAGSRVRGHIRKRHGSLSILSQNVKIQNTTILHKSP